MKAVCESAEAATHLRQMRPEAAQSLAARLEAVPAKFVVRFTLATDICRCQ
jgi:outer membrane lipopolysaccharide assembly protein LptE/RlpB